MADAPPVRPPVKLSGGASSGYKAEMYSPPVYLLHSPLRTPANKHKDPQAVVAEANALWDQVVSMRLSDFAPHGLPTATISIRAPTEEDLEGLGNG